MDDYAEMAAEAHRLMPSAEEMAEGFEELRMATTMSMEQAAQSIAEVTPEPWSCADLTHPPY